MRQPISFAWAMAVVLFLGSDAWARRVFEFDFAGPEKIEAAPGESVDVEVTAQLVARGVESPEEGVEAWSMAIRVSGASIISLDVDGAFADPEVSFVWSEYIDDVAIVAVLLDFAADGEPPATLPLGESPYDIAAIKLRGVVPVDDSCALITLDYVDRLEGSGRPVTNTVTASGMPFQPILNGKLIRLKQPDPPATPPIELSEVDTVFTAALLPCDTTALFSFTVPDPPAGEVRSPVAVALAAENPEDSNVLFFRWGSPPSPTEFDFVAAAPASANQALLIPFSRDETGFVLVESTVLTGDSAAITLTARLADLKIESVSPSLAAENSVISVLVLGGGFREGFSTFTLEGPDSSIAATTTSVISADRAELVFDLRGHPKGTYAIKVTDATGQITDTRSRALRIVDPSVLFGLELEISGQSRYRIRSDDGSIRQNRVTFTYRNVSTEELAAPLFHIRGPVGMKLRTESEDEFHDQEMFVLGIDAGGTAGRLAPGAERDVPIIFTSDLIGDLSVFEVRLFTPNAGDFIAWDAMARPAGIAEETWPSVRDRLRVTLGPTWPDYSASIAELATRLTRRGIDATSLLSLSRFATREALLRPTAGVLGQVVTDSGRTLTNTIVQVTENGEAVSSAYTDDAGTFVLDWLENEKEYVLRVGGFTDRLDVVLPASGDRYGQLIVVTSAEQEELTDQCRDCDESGLPTEPIVPPLNLFTPLLEWETVLTGSIDPNEKQPPPGEGELGCVNLPSRSGFVRAGCVGPDTNLFYTIHFENLGNAPAKKVSIVDRLDPLLDIDSVRPVDVNVPHSSPLSLDIQPGSRYDGYYPNPQARFSDTVSRSQEIELPDLGRVVVDVLWEIDRERRVIRWDVTAPEAAGDDDGFLPPRGQGSVSFTARLLAEATEEGVDLENDATITFDNVSSAALDTNGVVNRFSEFLIPRVARGHHPADGGTVDPGVALLWEKFPNAFFYDLFIWPADNAERDEAVGRSLPSTSFRPAGLEFATTYNWQVEARNLRDQRTEGPVWTFTTTAPPNCPSAPGGLVVEGDGNCLVAPVLKWNSVDSASAYTVRLQKGAEIADQVDIGAITATELELPVWIEAGSYTWRVIAVNETCPEGDTSSVSEPLTLVVCRGQPFRRGDANDDEQVDIADALYLLNALFAGGPSLLCRKSGDVNGDTDVNVADAIYLLLRLFGAGPPVPPPAEECGISPTPDNLECNESKCS